MSRPRSAHSSRPDTSANVTSDHAARNNRWSATAAEQARTAARDSSEQAQDPTVGQWARFVRELIEARIDPADLVSVAAEVAADRDYPHHVRNLIARRACQLAQQACPPTAATTLLAIRTYAVVLDDAGHHEQAADLWQQLATRYQTAQLPGLAQQPRLAYAAGLHRQGRCVEALDQISLAWQTAREAVDEHSPAAATVLRLYRLMLDACHPGVNTTPARPTAPDQALQPNALLDTPPLTGVLEHRRVCAYRSRMGSRAGR